METCQTKLDFTHLVEADLVCVNMDPCCVGIGWDQKEKIFCLVL